MASKKQYPGAFRAAEIDDLLAKIRDLEIDGALSSSSINPVQNKVITDEIGKVDTHIAETKQLISALSSLVQHLTDIGLVQTQYQFAFLEEENMDRLTADQMSEMIIYAGLEEEEPSSEKSVYDAANKSLTVAGTLDDKTLSISGSFDPNTKTLTL